MAAVETARRLKMSSVPETFAICRLPPDAMTPRWAGTGLLFSVTRTPDELSIICPEANVPGGVLCDRGWGCLKVDGPLEFSAIGVVASLAQPLAAAGVSIFVVSTYNTDYLLVKSESLAKAMEVLRAAGHEV
jgi:uncharacterized protein